LSSKDRQKEKDFAKLHDKIIKQALKYSNHLIEEGIKSSSFTLTNSFVVIFRDLKRKPRVSKGKSNAK